jgi:hypothetical protein
VPAAPSRLHLHRRRRGPSTDLLPLVRAPAQQEQDDERNQHDDDDADDDAGDGAALELLLALGLSDFAGRLAQDEVEEGCCGARGMLAWVVSTHGGAMRTLGR